MSLQVRVDGVKVEVPAGATVLEATQAAGKWVPTLCYDERQEPFGACRVCLVGSSQASAGEDARAVIPACTTPCVDDMAIHTDDPRARRVATAVVELVLSELPMAPPERQRADRDRCAARGRRAPVARRGSRGPPRGRSPPVPDLPARPVHLLRSLRPGVRRGPGDLRADRDRSGFRGEHRGWARPGVPRFGLCFVWRLCRHVSHQAIGEPTLIALDRGRMR